jgi:hypothetical protein
MNWVNYKAAERGVSYLQRLFVSFRFSFFVTWRAEFPNKYSSKAAALMLLRFPLFYAEDNCLFIAEWLFVC